MSSNPLREWGTALLVLGSILAVIAGAFFAAQGLLEYAGPRTYGFADTAVGWGWLAVMLCVVGGALRLMDYVTIVRPRRLTTDLRPR